MVEEAEAGSISSMEMLAHSAFWYRCLLSKPEEKSAPHVESSLLVSSCHSK